MTTIFVIDADGHRRALAAIEGASLMELLRDEGAVEAVCGGGASCGTCAVRIEAPGCEALAPPGADERLLLDGLQSVGGFGAGLRLSCQIPCTPALDQVVLHLVPAF